jgi:L-alanine-DL-glutamate epimerase-like enolase superfamily enzyme
MRIADIQVSAYRIPTDRPEADGTIHWTSTTLIVVDAIADSGVRGIGYTYAAMAAVSVIDELLREAVVGCPVDDTRAMWEAMVRRVRNAGRPGIAATAISAVDTALWDLKAKTHDTALCTLLGARRETVPIYGSGGFTSYTEAELVEQLTDWVAAGIPRVKMKIGKEWGTFEHEDLERIHLARRAIGERAELFVDANGAYTVKQAIRVAHRAADAGVTYFEEPISSDHRDELRMVREQAPMDIAAGEYGYDPWYFRDLLEARAVDIMQADATRCLGVTGWLEAAAVAHSFATPLSSHCAPSIHAHLGAAAPQFSHAEYFHDHVRIEHLLFDGALDPIGGELRPDPSRPGLGLAFKRADAARLSV